MKFIVIFILKKSLIKKKIEKRIKVWTNYGWGTYKRIAYS